MADDYTDIFCLGDNLVARAPPEISGRLEVRGVGIVTVPVLGEARIGLIVDLSPLEEIERLPDPATGELAEKSFPILRLDASTPSAAAKLSFVLGELSRTGAMPGNAS